MSTSFGGNVHAARRTVSLSELIIISGSNNQEDKYIIYTGRIIPVGPRSMVKKGTQIHYNYFGMYVRILTSVFTASITKQSENESCK